MSSSQPGSQQWIRIFTTKRLKKKVPKKNYQLSQLGGLNSTAENEVWHLMNPALWGNLIVNLEEKQGEKREHQSKENKETLITVYYIYLCFWEIAHLPLP